MAIPAWPRAKDPDETVDYRVDWTKEIPEGETIEDSTWDVPAGLVSVEDAWDGMVTRIRLAGGTLDEVYTLVNTVTTSSGQILQQSIRLRVKER